MNYEEKYKEALERAKKLHDSYNLMHISVDEIEQIFPELAESEDERIMSRIIDGFKNFSRSASKWNNIQVEEVIVYLEKQKEQKLWSKEDEKTINDACCWIAEYAGYLMDKNYGKASMLMSLTEKLKSLRPSLKPSEEQMEALRRAVNKLAKTDVADSVRLSIMYDNLKKL